MNSPIHPANRLSWRWTAPTAFRKHPRLAWGFYGHRLALYRATQPHEGFSILRRWAERMRGWDGRPDRALVRGIAEGAADSYQSARKSDQHRIRCRSGESGATRVAKP